MSIPMRLTILNSELYSTADFVIVAPMLLTTLDSELYSTEAYPIYNFYYVSSGNLTLGGTSLVQNRVEYKYTASGNLLLNNISSFEIQSELLKIIYYEDVLNYNIFIEAFKSKTILKASMKIC